MLIPIFKPGDVLFDKININGGKILVLDSKIKSETTEYTTDMDFGCSVTRHEIKTSEWVEYGVINDGFNFVRIAEDALCRWYRRVNHVDLPCNFDEADSGEKDEEIRLLRSENDELKESCVKYKKDIFSLMHDKIASEAKIYSLNREIKDLNDQLRIAYGCIDRFTIDAVAGMRRVGCSVEKIAKTLNMPEQAVKVYLNAADVLDCKEEE